ncbi:unnamed protein product [Cladocopium goreaui]|uniref:Uncharacterized protein n=1 Tax=Cladocopium goreaui TaxID=2562237 RepID=A0A9P1DMR2_9DINO|nr:unnamed protein product [Cladocopium goreaui]
MFFTPFVHTWKRHILGMPFFGGRGKSCQELTATEMRETRETHRDVLEQKEGVKWHTGVEGWEVKIDVAGRSIRGGYFIPKKEEDEASPDSQNKWEKAVKEELENAVKCRENLERRYREAE